MWRKIAKVAFFVTGLLLASCCPKHADTMYEYSDFKDREISWNCVFFQAKPHYFVYVYSETCFFCNEIKNQVLSCFECSQFDMYLVHISNEIPTCENYQITIGVNNIKDVCIRGVPSLLEIKDYILINNYAGKSEILEALSKN